MLAEQTGLEAVAGEGGTGTTMKHRTCLRPSRWGWGAGPRLGSEAT